MSFPPRLRSLVDQLPFELADVEAANTVFERWAENEASHDKRIVDIWTYCYVVQYFYVKSVQDEIRGASDVDALVTKAYERVNEKRPGLREPDRYAHWVSVVCKRVFLNHVRDGFEKASIHADDGPRLPPADTSRSYNDLGFTRQVVANAIDRLPDYLQEPARLYFLEERTFVEISEEIDKPVSTVRAYKHKIVKRLRDDDALVTLMQWREM
jgi:RNA polymerase sigma factor (sigma-70 family)